VSAYGLRPVPLLRERAALVAALLVLSAVGWAVTGERMGGMDDGPGTDPGTLGFFLTAWVVMMGTMMFPSVAPMVVAYDRIRSRRRELGRSAPAAGTAAFVSGYLAVWTGFGLFAYAAYQFADGLSIDALSWDGAGPWIAGALIGSAAIYELTPAKEVCLRKCRTPLAFLFGGWRDGLGGAFRLGASHGAWCVGCCWGLMVALFALGVMSLPWMAFVAALIAAEKLLPWGRTPSRVTAVLLLALGLAVAIVPERVPALSEPGSMTMHDDKGSMSTHDRKGSMSTHDGKGSMSTHERRGSTPMHGGTMDDGHGAGRGGR
jgi:predicted metal-binding membrane protein